MLPITRWEVGPMVPFGLLSSLPRIPCAPCQGAGLLLLGSEDIGFAKSRATSTCSCFTEGHVKLL